MSNRIEDYTDARKKRADRLASYRQVTGKLKEQRDGQMRKMLLL